MLHRDAEGVDAGTQELLVGEAEILDGDAAEAVVGKGQRGVGLVGGKEVVVEGEVMLADGMDVVGCSGDAVGPVQQADAAGPLSGSGAQDRRGRCGRRV